MLATPSIWYGTQIRKQLAFSKARGRCSTFYVLICHIRDYHSTFAISASAIRAGDALLTLTVSSILWFLRTQIRKESIFSKARGRCATFFIPICHIWDYHSTLAISALGTSAGDALLTLTVLSILWFPIKIKGVTYQVCYVLSTYDFSVLKYKNEFYSIINRAKSFKKSFMVTRLEKYALGKKACQQW